MAKNKRIVRRTPVAHPPPGGWPAPSKPPSSIPAVVQLPGGVRLSGVKFRVVTYHDDDSPAVFELLAPGDSGDPKRDDIWTLFANEDEIRAPSVGIKRIVPWPAGEPLRYNGSGAPCDAWTGPCCCGATHREGV